MRKSPISNYLRPLNHSCRPLSGAVSPMRDAHGLMAVQHVNNATRRACIDTQRGGGRRPGCTRQSHTDTKRAVCGFEALQTAPNRHAGSHRVGWLSRSSACHSECGSQVRFTLPLGPVLHLERPNAYTPAYQGLCKMLAMRPKLSALHVSSPLRLPPHNRFGNSSPSCRKCFSVACAAPVRK
jgi:hypothetical protein